MTPAHTCLEFDGAEIHVSVDLHVYRLAAVQKAGYRFADRFTLIIGALDGDSLPLTLRFADGTGSEAALACARDFFDELLDQELREKIGEETRAIRALILAQAFSKTDLISRE